MAEELSEEQRWPAVRRAYDFVLPSYQMMAGRFEAADTRLTGVMTLAVTLTLGAPIFAKSINQNISFTSPWFLAAIVMFVIGIVQGIAGRLMGSLTLPDPMRLYKASLGDSEWTFMKNQIYFAGVHFDANANAVRKKSNVTLRVAGLLAIEILALVGWVAR